MLPASGPPTVLPVAHPVTGHPHVDLPVLLLAVLSFCLVLAVGLGMPRGATKGSMPPPASWEGSLSAPQKAVRAVSVGVLLLCLAAARLGTASELDNLAPALVLGVAWPLLFLGALLLGSSWRWLDPWDAGARVLVPGDRSRPEDDVRPAVALALPVLWYVAVHPTPLDPRDLGVALAAYVTVAVAGSLALGRRRWLSTADPVGVVLTWVGRARPAWAASSATPPGSAAPLGVRAPTGLGALYGVFAGALLFGAYRRSETWTGLVDVTDAVVATAAMLAFAALGAAVVTLLARVSGLLAPRRQRVDTVDPAAVVVLAFGPVIVGVVVAVALARNRFFNAVQLLPGLVGDPLGLGWDLLGDSLAGLDPAPLGAAGLLATQLVVLLATHLWGVVLAGRLLPRAARLPAVLLLAQSSAATLAVISAH